MTIINSQTKLSEFLANHKNIEEYEGITFENVVFPTLSNISAFVGCIFKNCEFHSITFSSFYYCVFDRNLFTGMIKHSYFLEPTFRQCGFYCDIKRTEFVDGELFDCMFGNYNTDHRLLSDCFYARFTKCRFIAISFEMCEIDDYASSSELIFTQCSFNKPNMLPASFIDFPYKNATVLNEPIIGFKAVYINNIRRVIGSSPSPSPRSYVIAKIEIPAGAVVVSPNGTKCRTNKAKVIGFNQKDVERGYSFYNGMSHYIGDEFNIKNFDGTNWRECTTGYHFFKTEEEARLYAKERM